jgi:hypothetical protein
MSDRNRMSGKVASDALKSRNNAGMNYLKQTKAIAPLFKTNKHEAVRQMTVARVKLRAAEKAPNGSVLRSFTKH